MKYRRSWLHPCRVRAAAAPGGAGQDATQQHNAEHRIDEPQKSSRVRRAQLRPNRRGLSLTAAAAAALLTLASGCTFSTTSHGWPGDYAPAGIPNAQDCVPIHFGQPTDFACPGGKVYTAQQLKSLRQEKAKSTVASAGY